MNRRKKRPPAYQPMPPVPLVQVLPDQQARIDPSAIPQLVCYFGAIRERYQRAAAETLSNKFGAMREMAKGRIAYAKCMCMAIDALAKTLYETIDLRAYDRARDEWERTLRDIGGEG